MGYLRWVPNIRVEKTLFRDRGSNPSRLRDRPTLYHVAIKAGLYRKAVQVYHIPIPGDTQFSLSESRCSAGHCKCRICPMHSDRQAKANSVDADQTPLNAASDQGLHCWYIIQQFLTHQQTEAWTYANFSINMVRG